MKKNLLIGAALAATALLLLGSTAAFNGQQVEVCHVPPGNPANFHTITVNENAISAHLAHGDTVGQCDALCATLCDDGNACTIDDTGDCELNGCPVALEAVDCDDGNACTLDSCDEIAGCVNVPVECPEGQSCDESTGACVANVCEAECPPGQSCDPSTGECGAYDPCVAQTNSDACFLLSFSLPGAQYCVWDSDEEFCVFFPD